MSNIVVLVVVGVSISLSILSNHKRILAEERLNEFVTRQMDIDSGVAKARGDFEGCVKRNHKLMRMMWAGHYQDRDYLQLVKEIKKRNEKYGIGGN